VASTVNEPQAPPVLDVNGLSVAYGRQAVVEGVSFQIHHGEIFGLLGPTGQGRRTLSAPSRGWLGPRLGACWCMASTFAKSHWKRGLASGCNCSPQVSRPS
jgi:ABC-2 type transport system ATP-binding protein